MCTRFSLQVALAMAGAWIAVSSPAAQGEKSDRGPGLTLEQVAVAGGVSQPVISPDGSQVAFVSAIGSDAELFVVPARGGYPLRLTYSAGSKSSPSWSPDGRQIAFLSDGEIWNFRAEGGTPKKLTTGHRAESPVWSPRGDEIAFVSNLEGNQDIAAVPVDGGWPRRIVGGPLDESSPSWSPDGSRVAFIRRDAA
jgi:TolB protein